MDITVNRSVEEIEDCLRSKIDNRNINVLNKNKNGQGFYTEHPVLLVPEYLGISASQRRNIYFKRTETPKSQRKFHANDPNNYYKSHNIMFK